MEPSYSCRMSGMNSRSGTTRSNRGWPGERRRNNCAVLATQTQHVPNKAGTTFHLEFRLHKDPISSDSRSPAALRLVQRSFFFHSTAPTPRPRLRSMNPRRGHVHGACAKPTKDQKRKKKKKKKRAAKTKVERIQAMAGAKAGRLTVGVLTLSLRRSVV